ncbi:MAG: histidine kinase, partial [Coriobacteriia bacterium]|nr:histidine kinase [Coriobacteriia bacterium]
FHERSILVTLVLATLCFVPLIWRRDRPLVVLVVVTAAQCALTLWTHDPLLTFIAPLIALYTLGTQASMRRLVIATVAVSLVLVGANRFVPVMGTDVVLKEREAVQGGSYDRGARQDFGDADDSGNDLMQRKRVVPDGAEARPLGSLGSGASGGIPGGNMESGGTHQVLRLQAPSRFARGFVNLSRGRVFAGMLQIVASLVAFAALGRMACLHREHVAEAEHAREEAALRRAEEVRLRIAREVHDITAHSLATVAVQAGAAEALARSGDVDRAMSAIAALRETAKRSLDELRYTVGVLRGDGGSGGGGGAGSGGSSGIGGGSSGIGGGSSGSRSTGACDAPLAPEVSLAGLDTLLDSFKTAGLLIDLEIREEGNSLVSLPKAVDIAAYRVVQESLTNVLRHAADPSRATVRLTVLERSLSVEICDDADSCGMGVAQSVPEWALGHGIAGMRERVLALNGSFEAGPVTGSRIAAAAADGDATTTADATAGAGAATAVATDAVAAVATGAAPAVGFQVRAVMPL